MLLEQIPVLRDLTLFAIIFRCILAMLFSGILGYEREKQRRPAGFRTYIVVCLGSCLAMMTGLYLYDMTGSGDPGRIAAQVISGIGFLGAGTILVTKHNQVRGLTTAAGLWAAACLGLALGAGFYTGALIVFWGLWLSLQLLRLVDRHLYTHSKIMALYVEFNGIQDVSSFIAFAKDHHCHVSNLEMSHSRNPEGSGLICAVVTLHFAENVSHSQIVELYGALEGVAFIEEI